MPQVDMSADSLAAYLQTIDRTELLKMAKRSLSQAKPNATKDVAEICQMLSKRAVQP